MTNEQNNQNPTSKPSDEQAKKPSPENAQQQNQGQPSSGAEKPAQQDQGDAAKKQQS